MDIGFAKEDFDLEKVKGEIARLKIVRANLAAELRVLHDTKQLSRAMFYELEASYDLAADRQFLLEQMLETYE